MRFSWVMFFCQDATDHRTLSGSADSPLYGCRDHATPPLLGSKHGMGPLGFRWSYADNLGVWHTVKTAPTFISHVSSQVFRNAVSIFTTYHLQNGSADVVGYEVFPSRRVLQWNEQADVTHLISRINGLFAPSHYQVGNGAHQRSQVFLGTQQSWCSLDLDASSFKLARASYLVSEEPWSTVRLEQRACGGFLCLLRSNWSLR